MTKEQVLKISLIMTGLLLLILIAGCGHRARFTSAYAGCAVNGSQIQCPDGSFFDIPSGTDGINGDDGKDGSDGVDGVKGDKGDKGSKGDKGVAGEDGEDGTDGLIVGVLDPCGDDLGEVDEVILELSDGRFLAWFHNTGLFILEQNVQYQTTDKQKCNFKIVNGVLQ